GVAHLRPVERDPHGALVEGPVVGDVGEVEPLHLPPGGGVERLGDHGPFLAHPPPAPRRPRPPSGVHWRKYPHESSSYFLQRRWLGADGRSCDVACWARGSGSRCSPCWPAPSPASRRRRRRRRSGWWTVRVG